jgi:hypothetical protein
VVVVLDGEDDFGLVREGKIRKEKIGKSRVCEREGTVTHYYIYTYLTCAQIRGMLPRLGLGGVMSGQVAPSL